MWFCSTHVGKVSDHMIQKQRFHDISRIAVFQFAKRKKYTRRRVSSIWCDVQLQNYQIFSILQLSVCKFGNDMIIYSAG